MNMALVYKVRDNDIVESRADLEQSIINNLSVFFDVFTQKLIYEIKFVSSITTQDGTEQKGATHQVLKSTTKTGIKKYKTIVNKFAVLDIFILLPGQTKKKITRLVLAPVNILSYKPTLQDLETQSNSIQLLIKTGLISAPAAEKPIITPAPAPAPTPTPTPTPTQTVTLIKGQTVAWWSDLYNTYSQQGNQNGWSWFWIGDGNNQALQRFYRKENGVWIEKTTLAEAQAYFQPGSATTTAYIPASTSATIPSVTPAPTPTVKPGAKASTLSEWYQAHGQKLPTVAERAQLYEKLGIDSAGLYVGSAEQNITLLKQLKAQ